MNRPEQQLHRAILQYIHLQYPKILVFHPANGGFRTVVEASIFKSLGVKAGTPDLCLLWKPGKVAFLEVKAGLGRLTTHQQSFHRWLGDLCIPVATVRSLEEAQEKMKEWGCR